MIKRRHIPDVHNEHPNVVPLIDVMLCIIVFYMLAAKIGVSSGADDSIKLPETNFGKEITEVGAGNTLIINVTESEGNPEPIVTAMVQGSERLQPLTLRNDDKTRPNLETELKKLAWGPDGRPNLANSPSLDDNTELKVVIRGDGERLTYRSFFPVMVAVTNAGIKNVFHNTKKSEQVSK